MSDIYLNIFSDTTYAFRVDIEIEEKAQEAIEAFFSKSCVVPSPWSDTSQRRTGFHLPQTPSTPGMVFTVFHCPTLSKFIENLFQGHLVYLIMELS